MEKEGKKKKSWFCNAPKPSLPAGLCVGITGYIFIREKYVLENNPAGLIVQRADAKREV